MDSQKLYIDKTEEIISYAELKDHFENGMEDWEREEYNNNFEEYLFAVCGGTAVR